MILLLYEITTNNNFSFPHMKIHARTDRDRAFVERRHDVSINTSIHMTNSQVYENKQNSHYGLFIQML